MPSAENVEGDGKEVKEWKKKNGCLNNRNSARIDSLRHCFPHSEFSLINLSNPW